MGANPKFAKEAKKEVPLSAFIPYTNHVTKHIVRLVGGEYIVTLKLSGAAHESADAQDINIWHDQLNNFLRNIASPQVAVWSHVVRRFYNEFPGGEFAPGFCADFNEHYRERVTVQKGLVNELYLTLVYRPEQNALGKFFGMFNKRSSEELAQQQKEAIEAVTDLMNAAVAALDRYEPEVLGCYEHNQLLFSETLEFLAFLVDGEWRRFPVTRSEIRDVLATSRPFFGKGGLMSFKGPSRSQYGAVIAIQEYPAITCPGILNDMLGMPFEFVLSQSFTFLGKQDALSSMKRQHGRMVNSGDLAQSQVADIEEAMDDLVSNRFVMGAHSLSLIIRADDTKALSDAISLTGASLSDAGMKWAREDAAMAGAFFAQLPGNFGYRIRVATITSRNFAGFACMHNYPIGRIRNNQWGDALTVFRTSSGSPYYFNFHKGEDGSDAKRAAKMDPNHKDLANTIVIGQSGAGKTVLENFLLAQAMKFNQPPAKRLTAVLFDKDLGASVAVRAMGGRYYPLKNGVPTGFNPFQLEPTPGNRTFIEGLVRQLVARADSPLTPSQEREIAKAIDGVMAAPKPMRRLGAVLQFLNPTDANGIHARLARWCGSAPLGWVFDNKEDTLVVDDCPVVGFDVTEFLANPETRTPVVMYLFHRIESLLDGRRVPIFMDEFGQLLNDKAFEDLSKNKLVTIRKQDGFLVMFTQSPKQVLSNPISFAIIEQTATKIFLPNPAADYKDYVEGFKLTVREYEIIRSLPEKSRRFLIKQGKNSVVAELNLKGFDDELAVLSGNTATSNLAEKLVAELGSNPAVWLPEFHRIRKEGV